MSEKMVTVVGGAYFGPIAALFAELDRFRNRSYSNVQASQNENGLAVSVCILAAACLESYVMRVRYLHDPNDLGFPKHGTSAKYLVSLYTDFDLSDECVEIALLRDALLHNHIWEIDYDYGDQGLVQRAIDKKSRGDGKYKGRIGEKRQRTPVLGLNVNPVLVGRPDAKEVLCAVWRILTFLEKKDHNQCAVIHVPVKFRDEILPLVEHMEQLCGNT